MPNSVPIIDKVHIDKTTFLSGMDINSWHNYNREIEVSIKHKFLFFTSPAQRYTLPICVSCYDSGRPPRIYIWTHRTRIINWYRLSERDIEKHILSVFVTKKIYAKELED